MLAFGILAVPLLEVLYVLDATHTGVGGDVLGQRDVGLDVQVGGVIDNLRNGVP